MAFFNYVTKEITLKVVYYGPGLSGKTTNLQHLYSVLDASSRGKFISLATESDRTLFFDFLPVELGKIKDFSVRFQLYTVPGQIRYNATRKLVLKGADAVVFVADSQRDMREQNLESWANMRENLVANNLNPDEIPVVLQFNKRDLPNILSIQELNSDLNRNNYETLETIASQGSGVQETFKLVTRLLLKDIAQKHKVDISSGKEEPITVKVTEKEKFDLAEEAASPQAAPIETGAARAAVTSREEVSPITAATPQAASAPRQTPTPQAAEPSPVVREAEEPSFRGRSAALSAFPYSDEKMTSVLSVLRDINRSLAGMHEALSALSKEVRETRKQQTDATKMLRELSLAMAEKKKKKSWWSRLFSR